MSEAVQRNRRRLRFEEGWKTDSAVRSEVERK